MFFLKNNFIDFLEKGDRRGRKKQRPQSRISFRCFAASCTPPPRARAYSPGIVLARHKTSLCPDPELTGHAQPPEPHRPGQKDLLRGACGHVGEKGGETWEIELSRLTKLKLGDGQREAGAGAEWRQAKGRKVETSIIVLTLKINFKDIKIVVNHKFLYFGPFSKLESFFFSFQLLM